MEDFLSNPLQFVGKLIWGVVGSIFSGIFSRILKPIGSFLGGLFSSGGDNTLNDGGSGGIFSSLFNTASASAPSSSSPDSGFSLGNMFNFFSHTSAPATAKAPETPSKSSWLGRHFHRIVNHHSSPDIAGASAAADQMRPEEVFEKGIVMQESRGHQYDKNGNVLRSPVGAIGLAQVMPKTGAGYGASETDLEDPVINRRVGLQVFTDQVKRYGNNTLAALAYNWGGGNVDKHIAEMGDPRKGEISMNEFIATVPVKEAREYVPAVLGHINSLKGEPDSPASQSQRIAAAKHGTSAPVG